MAVYNGMVREVSGDTNNWNLGATAGESARVLAVTVSGQVTSSVAMHTRHARGSAWNGNSTLGNTPAKSHPNSPAATLDFVTAYATRMPMAASCIGMLERPTKSGSS
jgi:hypothetical protein